MYSIIQTMTQKFYVLFVVVCRCLSSLFYIFLAAVHTIQPTSTDTGGRIVPFEFFKTNGSLGEGFNNIIQYNITESAILYDAVRDRERPRMMNIIKKSNLFIHSLFIVKNFQNSIQ